MPSHPTTPKKNLFTKKRHFATSLLNFPRLLDVACRWCAPGSTMCNVILLMFLKNVTSSTLTFREETDRQYQRLFTAKYNYKLPYLSINKTDISLCIILTITIIQLYEERFLLQHGNIASHWGWSLVFSDGQSWEMDKTFPSRKSLMLTHILNRSQQHHLHLKWIVCTSNQVWWTQTKDERGRRAKKNERPDAEVKAGQTQRS